MRCLLAAFACFSFFLMPIQLYAHPHVWVKSRSELVFDNKQQLVAVRHAWQFDEGFSAFATQGLDKNGDGKFSREELAELARVNIESMGEFEYFTFVQMGEADPKYEVPTEYWLEHQDGVLSLFFRLPMKEPVTPHPETGFKDLTVEVFDPTFFVDLTFVEEDPVGVIGANDSCRAGLQARKELDVFQSQLLSQIGPSETVPEEIAPQRGDLSNTIRVVCGAS